MKSEALSLKTIINKLDFLKKTLIIQWSNIKKDLQLITNKLTKKIPDLCNAKEHFQSFLRKKNTKSVKESKIIT